MLGMRTRGSAGLWQPRRGGVTQPGPSSWPPALLLCRSGPRAFMGAPAPALCLLLTCAWLPRGEPAGESLRVQRLGELGVDLPSEASRLAGDLVDGPGRVGERTGRGPGGGAVESRRGRPGTM